MARPLGLPVGSVRALCLVGLTTCAIVTLREHHEVASWLGAALLVSAAAYFASRSAHGAHHHEEPSSHPTTPRRHPLGFPVGTVRMLFLAAVAYGAYLWWADHWRGHGSPDEETQAFALVVGAFLIGVVVRWFLAQVRRPDDPSTLVFDHFQAFVAVASAAGLVAIAVTHRETEVTFWIEPTLAAVCTYYAGVR